MQYEKEIRGFHLELDTYESVNIEQVVYDDGSGSYHFVVSYVAVLNNNQTVCQFYPTTIDDMLKLPFVDFNTNMTVRTESGKVQGSTTVRQLYAVERSNNINDKLAELHAWKRCEAAMVNVIDNHDKTEGKFILDGLGKDQLEAVKMFINSFDTLGRE
jgi:hypothetical protein